MAWNEQVDLYVTTERNHADTFNARLEKVLENTQHNKDNVAELDNQLNNLADKLDQEYTKTEDLNELLAHGIKGDKGDGLQYDWDGTRLGVRVEGTEEYEYTDLKGEQGDVSLEQLEEAIKEAIKEAKTELKGVSLEQLSEVRTELQTEIANIPKVTKTSELTNDSGFITIKDIPEIDIPEIDLSAYALKTQIPTTLPASDVHAWAKASTKPTYTSAEVGALASNGTAVNASKVANALTLQIGGTTKNTFNGSSAQTFNIPNASTSAAGVMTAAMVTKLNGIATGATKNTVDTAMSSTSTNAVQNKVIYAYIQEQLKKAGDYMGKTMVNISTYTVSNPAGYTYTNAKGGLADLVFIAYDDRPNFQLFVDGVTILNGVVPSQYLKRITDNTYKYEIKIPFTSTFTITYYRGEDCYSYLRGFAYINN